VTNDAQTLCLCDIGYAALELTVLDNLTQPPREIKYTNCTQCPTGTVCDFRGANFSDLAAAVGYWQADCGEVICDFYRCLLPSQCLGGKGQGANCAANRVGPLCALCRDGYTASSVDGTCEICKTDGNAVGFTSIVIIGVVFVMWSQYYFVLWTSTPLLDAADVEDKVMASPHYILSREEFDMVRQLRYERYITTDGPPPPKPEVLYKLKIFLTFVQIMTNLSLSLQINYPPLFLKIINYFNPANLDFVSFTSADCVSSAINGYFTFFTWLLTPVGLIVLLFACFLAPHYCKSGRTEAMDKRRRRETYRLVMYTFFLVFPSVCNSTFGIFMCKEVEGIHYLVNDFSLLCFDERWTYVSYFAYAGIIVYPIGIPAFFYIMLRRYRYGKSGANRLQEKGIRAQLGFLYDCYETRVWWFEMLDMWHKLAMTSLISFFPFKFQLAMGTVVLMLYLSCLLIIDPYIRTGDDRLHLVAQVELLLLLMAGNCFQADVVPTDSINFVLTIVLLAMVFLFVGWFILSVSSVVRKMARTMTSPLGTVCRKCCCVKLQTLQVQQEKISTENPIIGAQYVLDRETVTSARTRILFSISGAQDVGFSKPGAEAEEADKGHTRTKSAAALSKIQDPLGFGLRS